MTTDDRYTVGRILDHCNAVMEFSRRLKSVNDFKENRLESDATVFNIVQLGENCAKLSKLFKDTYQEIDWRAVVDTRNRVVHSYEGIDYSVVLQILKKDVPALKHFCEEQLKREVENKKEPCVREDISQYSIIDRLNEKKRQIQPSKDNREEKTHNIEL